MPEPKDFWHNISDVCGLCGHDPACGYASVSREDGVQVRLCHNDNHSCYHLWTVYGRRPEISD